MSKIIVVMGAGTAGLTIANRLARDSIEVEVILIDPARWHVYQPGLLLVPFGYYVDTDLRREVRSLVYKNVQLIPQAVVKIDPEGKKVGLDDGREIQYDLGVISTGTRIAPQETKGMKEGGWRKNIFDFYTWDGAWALREKLDSWSGGKLVMHITEMPIKCPVAPLEFSFLADDFFLDKGIRDQVEITYVTPLSGAFTKPIANEKLSHLLKDKKINVVADFGVEKVDAERQELVSYDERVVAYDLLVTVPTNMGAEVILDANMGDELGFVPTDPHTLEARNHKNLFVVGDASNVATSKAGSAAHFEADVVVERLLAKLSDTKTEIEYDGHANCFVATGHKRALLLDFNFKVEPVEGLFPWPVIGPMKLLVETRMNWVAKLAWRYIYWGWLVTGKRMWGIPTAMSLKGKKLPGDNNE